MSLRAYSVFRRISKIDGRAFSTATNVKDVQEEQVPLYRTTESDPRNHSTHHLNKLYTIPSNIYSSLYQGCLPADFKKQVDTFAECSLLIREPAVEIISCLERTNYTKAVNKYVLYGKFGTGKSLTFMHILHYAFMKKFLLINVPWACSWFQRPKEVAVSSFAPDKIDLPLDAGFWLKHFKSQNLALLSELDLRISQDYTWSEREGLQKGEPLLTLIDFGISRVKFACNIINILVNEIKAASTAGKCRTLVAIDGYNAFFSDYTSARGDNKLPIPAKRITLTTAFLNMTDRNWCNGAIILTVDVRATKDKRESDLPRYLLGKEGFEHLDPFLPVAVDNYTPNEFESIMEYYKNRMWVRNITPEGQKELELLSNRNPYDLMDYCKAL